MHCTLFSSSYYTNSPTFLSQASQDLDLNFRPPELVMPLSRIGGETHLDVCDADVKVCKLREGRFSEVDVLRTYKRKVGWCDNKGESRHNSSFIVSLRFTRNGEGGVHRRLGRSEE